MICPLCGEFMEVKLIENGCFADGSPMRVTLYECDKCGFEDERYDPIDLDEESEGENRFPDINSDNAY